MLESTSPAFGGSGHNETGPPPALEYQGLRFLVSIIQSLCLILTSILIINGRVWCLSKNLSHNGDGWSSNWGVKKRSTECAGRQIKKKNQSFCCDGMYLTKNKHTLTK